jgi:hypothetical protein
MTTITKLDATLPAETSMVSDLVAIGQETRTTVNELIDTSTVAVVTALTLALGPNTLVIGSSGDLSNSFMEIAKLTPDVGGSSLFMISGGTEGQQKIFLFAGQVTVTDSATGFVLNSLPYPTDFIAQAGDVIAFVNEGGDTDLGLPGVWKELYRTVAV